MARAAATVSRPSLRSFRLLTRRHCSQKWAIAAFFLAALFFRAIPDETAHAVLFHGACGDLPDFHQNGVALSATAADGCDAEPAAAAFQLVHERH